MNQLKYKAWIDRLVRYWKCEWEIFCFVESAESLTNTNEYTLHKIKQIKIKYYGC